MPTVCQKGRQDQFEFQQAGRRKVQVGFDGGQITSDGGAVLLRELAERNGMFRQMAGCLVDHRNQDRITHSLQELLAQRVLGLACGYQDLNDHDQLRSDPMWGLLAGKAEPQSQPIAGKSTLNRLEAAATVAEPSGDRYRKFSVDGPAFQRLFARWYVAARAVDPPEQLVLDLDATDTPLHGDQEGKFFHGYYDHYCYLPLYIFAGEHLLWAELRRSNIDPAAGSVEAVAQIVGILREAWPTVTIILRADSGFAREELMSWCEDNGVDYLFGLAKNARLVRRITPQADLARELHAQTGRTERVFADCSYRTLDSWSRPRRVVGKAAWGAKGGNPRFVVTSLHPARWLPAELYEQLYCARGEAENRIKEQQLGLFAERTSCGRMAANQLRLWFSSAAYWLTVELRRLGLAGTRWARAQAETIRAQLLKIGGLVRSRMGQLASCLGALIPATADSLTIDVGCFGGNAVYPATV